MRRRAMGVAGLAIAFGVMLVGFGATAGVAERCKPDEQGGHGHEPATTAPTRRFRPPCPPPTR